MSDDQKRRVRNQFAEKAVMLAAQMDDARPILLLEDPATGLRETEALCPLSGEAGRVAVLSMSFCNPLVLNAAGIIEGSIR